MNELWFMFEWMNNVQWLLTRKDGGCFKINHQFSFLLKVRSNKESFKRQSFSNYSMNDDDDKDDEVF